MGIKVRTIKAFITGWFLLLTFQDNQEVQRKRKICSTCEHRKNFRCGLCGCPLSALTRSGDNDMCDAKKW